MARRRRRRLHATDAPADAHAEWVVDLTGDHIVWHRVQESSTHGETAGRAGAVSVRGPLTDLLLLVYRRRPPAGLDVLGDADLLDHWLSLVKFGRPVRTATA